MSAKGVVRLALLVLLSLPLAEAQAQSGDMLIDDFTSPDLVSTLGTQWRGVSDQVMGGVSVASVNRERIEGRSCLRLSGDVRLDNNGGFIQAALDLTPADGTLDASSYTGIRLVARGNNEQYSVHLRTPDNMRPWQSYRAEFIGGPDWATIDLPFATFLPYRLDAPLDTSRLRRLGLVAIGRAFRADLAVCRLELYR